MKSYWDSSALVEAASNEDLRDRLKSERGYTRTHTLGEIFSALTGGNLHIRVDADEAAEFARSLLDDLDFVDLTAVEVVQSLVAARARGVRGGRVHDFYMPKLRKSLEQRNS